MTMLLIVMNYEWDLDFACNPDSQKLQIMAVSETICSMVHQNFCESWALSFERRTQSHLWGVPGQRRTASHALGDCEVVAYLRFHHVGHYFMKSGDYQDAPLTRLLDLIRTVGLLSRWNSGGSTIDQWWLWSKDRSRPTPYSFYRLEKNADWKYEMRSFRPCSFLQISL
jgi:hypothetical protein